MMITGGTVSTPPALMLMAGAEQQSLAAMLGAQGFMPAATLSLDLVIPAGATVLLVDDLQQHGYGKVELRFEILAAAKLTYLMREVAGFAQGSIAPTTSIERSITCTLAGVGADANVRCLYFGDGDRVFKIKTHQEHKAGHATSNVVVKAVLTDSAKLTCNSMISIAPGADGSLAEQVNKNILLSSAARAVSIPMLEVLANDVRCKHGAAVSKLDSEQMFYLQSRGLTPEQTRSMLLEAFLS